MKSMRQTRRCPRCGSEQVIRITSGLPGSELATRVFREEVYVGGSAIDDESPEWRCRGCGHEFRTLTAPALDAVE
jgi:ribosomal protein L37AE/L43A